MPGRVQQRHPVSKQRERCGSPSCSPAVIVDWQRKPRPAAMMSQQLVRNGPSFPHLTLASALHNGTALLSLVDCRTRSLRVGVCVRRLETQLIIRTSVWGSLGGKPSPFGPAAGPRTRRRQALGIFRNMISTTREAGAPGKSHVSARGHQVLVVMQLFLKYAAYLFFLAVQRRASIHYTPHVTHSATAAASLVGKAEYAQLTIMLTISPQPKQTVSSDSPLEM